MEDGRWSLVEEHLHGSVRGEEEDPSNGLYEKQKHGRRYGRTHL